MGLSHMVFHSRLLLQFHHRRKLRRQSYDGKDFNNFLFLFCKNDLHVHCKKICLIIAVPILEIFLCFDSLKIQTYLCLKLIVRGVNNNYDNRKITAAL